MLALHMNHGLGGFDTQPVRVIAVTGGKGGVGKSNMAVSLGLALHGMGEQVLIWDANLSLPSVDLLMGIDADVTAHDVVSGSRTFEDAMIEIAPGLRVLAGSRGVERMTELSQLEVAGFVQAFGQGTVQMSTLVIDLPPGLSGTVLTIARAARDALIVTGDEPLAIADAISTMQVIGCRNTERRFHLLVNKVDSAVQGRRVFDAIAGQLPDDVVSSLFYAGCVPHDESVIEAVRRRQPFYQAFPQSMAAQSIQRIAASLRQWPLPTEASGQLEFFVERYYKSA